MCTNGCSAFCHQTPDCVTTCLFRWTNTKVLWRGSNLMGLGEPIEIARRRVPVIPRLCLDLERNTAGCWALHWCAATREMGIPEPQVCQIRDHSGPSHHCIYSAQNVYRGAVPNSQVPLAFRGWVSKGSVVCGHSRGSFNRKEGKTVALARNLSRARNYQGKWEEI